MAFFLAEFIKGQTGEDGIIDVQLKPSGSFAAPEATSLDAFCKRHNARVVGVTPGLVGAQATILICFESLEVS